jgi:EAL domain-containing protein (putative c-di-GMP-specific phosphodiesterase class I)
MHMKGTQQKLGENMRQWQKVENATISRTASVMEETGNPLIRLVMEIIQRDANLHYRVQQTIIDSLEKASIPIPVEDLQTVWASVEEHIQIERKSIELAKSSLEALGRTGNVVARYLLSYLMEDEKKHEKLLTNLELIKKGMYP